MHIQKALDQMDSLVAGASARGKNGRNSVPGGAMKVSSRNGQHALQVTVIPTPDNLRAIEDNPCVLVFVNTPSLLPKSRAAFMRQLYALTPTEARWADLLLQGLEVREVADEMQTTLETTRFHLKRVLAKTGARRQTELMRLMLALPGQQSRSPYALVSRLLESVDACH
jgi:DNA-binding CsgD family transcriptional regulator